MMRKFSEQYAKRFALARWPPLRAVSRPLSCLLYAKPRDGCLRTGTYFCVDKSVTAVVIKVGASSCPR